MIPAENPDNMLSRRLSGRLSRSPKSMGGFTLLETVITIALTAVIMLAIANLYINFNTLYIYQETYTATTNAASSALSAVSAAVLPANQVVASHSFTIGTLSSGTSTVVFELPSVSASGAIVANAHDYIGFYIAGTDFYRVVAANASSARISGTKRIAPLVSAMTFGYDTADPTQATRISATTTTALSTQRSGVVETTLHEQFYLRNR